jgi:hypothetical protein
MTTPVFTQASDDTLSDVSIQIVLPMNKDLDRYIQGFRSELQSSCHFLLLFFLWWFATYSLYSKFQIIRRFGFSRYIVFAMHLDIHYV